MPALRAAVSLGDAKAPPRLPEMLKALERPKTSLSVNLLAVSIEDRPAVFAALRRGARRYARPNRPAALDRSSTRRTTCCRRNGTPRRGGVAHSCDPRRRRSRKPWRRRARAGGRRVRGRNEARRDDPRPSAGRSGSSRPRFRPRPARAWPAAVLAQVAPASRRNSSSRARPPPRRSGTPENTPRASSARTRAFISAGRTGALNLRAQNLTIFLQIADGVDDRTWLHHLKGHDVSTLDARGDQGRGAGGRASGSRRPPDPAQLRKAMREAIERKYTAPAAKGS